MNDDEEASEFSIDFGQNRFNEILLTLKKLSPTIAEEVRAGSADGTLFESMNNASRTLSTITAQLFVSDGKLFDKIKKELALSMGKSYNKTNVIALLSAHAGGIAHMASIDGLSQTIFFHYANLFKVNLENYIKEKKPDPETAGSALNLISAWMRTLISQYITGDQDDPIRSLAFSNDSEDAARWAGELMVRSARSSDDQGVQSLIRDSFYRPAGKDKIETVHLEDLETTDHKLAIDKRKKK